MIEGRDAHGRFAPGYSPDRGRGTPAGPRLILNEDMRRIVMAIANLPISIPRGRGRRVVTLYEFQIRKLATGRVYRRAAVMDFIRLVQEAAVLTPAPQPAAPPALITSFQEAFNAFLSSTRNKDVERTGQIMAAVYEVLDDLARHKPAC